MNTWRRYAAVAALGVMICGCARQLTYERWNTLHNGATPEAVEATLGEPWQRMDDTWLYHDRGRGITATIYFERDRMTGKQWADPDRGVVGSNPRVRQPGDAEELRVQAIEED